MRNQALDHDSWVDQQRLGDLETYIVDTRQRCRALCVLAQLAERYQTLTYETQDDPGAADDAFAIQIAAMKLCIHLQLNVPGWALEWVVP